MTMNLEKRAEAHPKKAEEESAREYLTDVYTGRLKAPSEPLIKHAVSDIVKSLLRDASVHRIHRSTDFNYIVALCKFWDYPVSTETIQSGEFVDYWNRNCKNFTSEMVKKLVPKALGINS